MKLSELKCICENINIDDYIIYRDDVKNYMEYPEWLGDFSKDDLVNLLNNGSKIWVYYLDNDFVCSMMLIPADKNSIDKFGIDVDYKEVVDYGPMFVNYKYIGNKLQFQMLDDLDKYSLDMGYKFAVSTIHPDNIYSINNLEKDNFKCIGTKEFKRGIRNIYFKNL